MSVDRGPDSSGNSSHHEGQPVIVCGQDAGGNTYRSAIVTMTNLGEHSDPKEGEAGAATAAGRVKVRFTGTSKGISDEMVQVKDVLRVTEKTMQLKKEYEVRKGKGHKPSGRGRGRPPKKKPAPTETSTAAPAPASASSGLSDSSKRTPGGLMLSRPSPLPFASASATTAKSKSGLTIGSTVPVERAASPDGSKRSRDSSGASNSGVEVGSGSGSTAANPWSGDVMRSARSSCDRDSSRRSGDEQEQEQEQEQELQPPSFPDMVVEALHALSDSRGSSKLATVKWLKSSSRYGWMAAPPDEAKFKANVAAGVKQALEEGKVVQVRTNYRISPDHARALNLGLPTKPNKRRRKNSSTTSGGSTDPAPDARPAAAAAAAYVAAAATAATDGTINRMDDTERESTLCGGGGNGGERGGGDGDNDDEPTTTIEMTVVSARVDNPHTNTGADDSSTPGPAPDATPEASSIISGCSEPPPEPSPPRLVGDGGGAPSHGLKEAVTEEEGTGGLAWAAGEEPKPKAIKRPTGRSKGRTPKTIDGGGSSSSGGGGGVPKGSSVSRSQALDLVEDDVLHAREQEAQTGDGATDEPPLRPPRPTPVNRLRVPAGVVGDLLTVWDFLKTFGQELHLKEASVLTLEEFETAVLWSSNNSKSKKSVHPLIAGLHLALLREALGRKADGSPCGEAEAVMTSMVPVRRILGDLLNPATWPEVLRRFAMAYLRYSRALFSRHGRGRGEGVDEAHPLATAVETLSRRGYGDLSSSETLCVLRWLSDVLMDSRSVRRKIAQHAERQSRVTAGDRKKAEERDHLVAESLSRALAHRGTAVDETAVGKTAVDEPPKPEGNERVAEERIEEAASAVVGGNAAGTAASGTPLTLEEKEALVSARAEEKRSAVRREALGWDREFNRYWWFGGGPSEVIHVEKKGGDVWGQYRSQQEVDALMDSQHPRGKRGAPLRRRLCQSKDEMQVGFERVRLVDAAEEAERKAREDSKQERLRQLVEAEAEAKAAEAAAAAAAAAAARGADGDSSTRRSSRNRPGPSSPGNSAAVSMTTAAHPVGDLEHLAQGSTGNSNSSSSSSSSSRMEAARAAAEAEAAQPYVPLLPAWRHVARRGDRDFLRNLKLELTSLEEQVAPLGNTTVTGKHSKDRHGWVREVATARDALALRRPAVQLEEALYACSRDMIGNLAMDWSSMAVADGEDVSWDSPYDWTFLKSQGRDRRKGKDREQRASLGEDGRATPNATVGSGRAAVGGGGPTAAAVGASACAPSRGKRKVAKKREGGRELTRPAAAQAAAAEAAVSLAAAALTCRGRQEGEGTREGTQGASKMAREEVVEEARVFAAGDSAGAGATSLAELLVSGGEAPPGKISAGCVPSAARVDFQDEDDAEKMTEKADSQLPAADTPANEATPVTGDKQDAATSTINTARSGGLQASDSAQGRAYSTPLEGKGGVARPASSSEQATARDGGEGLNASNTNSANSNSSYSNNSSAAPADAEGTSVGTSDTSTATGRTVASEPKATTPAVVTRASEEAKEVKAGKADISGDSSGGSRGGRVVGPAGVDEEKDGTRLKEEAGDGTATHGGGSISHPPEAAGGGSAADNVASEASSGPMEVEGGGLELEKDSTAMKTAAVEESREPAGMSDDRNGDKTLVLDGQTEATPAAGDDTGPKAACFVKDAAGAAAVATVAAAPTVAAAATPADSGGNEGDGGSSDGGNPSKTAGVDRFEKTKPSGTRDDNDDGYDDAEVPESVEGMQEESGRDPGAGEQLVEEDNAVPAAAVSAATATATATAVSGAAATVALGVGGSGSTKKTTTTMTKAEADDAGLTEGNEMDGMDEAAEEEEDEEEEEEEVEPEKRWEMEREGIALANLSAELQGALSTGPAFREAWRQEMLAARTLAGVATLVYSLLASAAGVLPALQEQDMQEQALVSQDLATNQALHVRCSSTSEIVWARLHGFPWWPALVVKPEGVGFQRNLLETGDRLVVFMNEHQQFRVNHRFCKPYVGTTKHDDVMRRASRNNRRMARAIKMATKGLRVAHERFGSDGDPNAPHNRPNFDTQDTQHQPAAAAAAAAAAPPAAGTRLTGSATAAPPAAAGKVLTGSATATTHRSAPPGQAAQRGLALAGAAAAAAAGGETVKVSRPRRTPKVPKYLTEGMVGDGGADAPVRSIAGKGKKRKDGGVGGSTGMWQARKSQKRGDGGDGSELEQHQPAAPAERQPSRKKMPAALAQAELARGSMNMVR
ncbi:unnamed protein product [Ectocarpus sp. 12 AP-2014]